MTPQGSNLVIYGDSILQALRFEDGVSKGAIEVGERRFGKYNPLIFAVGGARMPFAAISTTPEVVCNTAAPGCKHL